MDREEEFDCDSFTRVEPPASGNEEVRRRHEANRQGWNEGASKYTESIERDIEFIRQGGSNLHPIERRNLGKVGEWCRTAIHLQCASGRDTLSLWNEGVEEVIGVDISDVHIGNARRISEAVGAEARWYRCDVLDVPEELNGIADLVYAGRGALCWLHDLERWTRVIARLLKPGGVFHILDDHPFTWLFDSQQERLIFSEVNYFNYAESNKGWGSNFIGKLDMPVEKESTKYERLWSLASIIQGVFDAGMEIEFFGEHKEEYWDSFPILTDEQRKLIPMTFSLMAKKRQS